MACFLSWSHSQLLSGAFSLEHCNWGAGCQQEQRAGTACGAPGASLKDLITLQASPSQTNHQEHQLSPSSRWERDQDVPPVSHKTFPAPSADSICPRAAPEQPVPSYHIPAPPDWEGCDGSCEMRCLCCHCDLTTSKCAVRSCFFSLPVAAHNHPGKGWDAVSTSCPLSLPQRQGAIATDLGGRISSRFPVK